MKKYVANYPSDKDILAQYYKQQEWERYKVYFSHNCFFFFFFFLFGIVRLLTLFSTSSFSTSSSTRHFSTYPTLYPSFFFLLYLFFSLLAIINRPFLPFPFFLFFSFILFFSHSLATLYHDDTRSKHTNPFLIPFHPQPAFQTTMPFLFFFSPRSLHPLFDLFFFLYQPNIFSATSSPPTTPPSMPSFLSLPHQITIFL
jgi:hypothetical protein